MTVSKRDKMKEFVNKNQDIINQINVETRTLGTIRDEWRVEREFMPNEWNQAVLYCEEYQSIESPEEVAIIVYWSEKPL